MRASSDHISISVLKRLSLVALLSVALTAQGVMMADARPGDGGSMGSRGTRTFSAPPATNTAPSGAAPMQRSITQPGPTSPSLGGQQPHIQQPAVAPSFGRSLLGGLAGGFLGAGLFGMLSGHGFMGGMGGFMSMIGLIFQIVLVVGLVALLVRLFRKPEPEPAYADQGYARSPATMMPAASGGVSSSPVQIGGQDYADFERLLGSIQEAYSREDLSALRNMATPEMVSYFGDDLARNSQNGLVDQVSQVKLLQGDLAESWNENGSDYATVAMRFSFINVMRERTSNRVVSGDPNQMQEATEIWTFRRSPGGSWMLSAIQQTH